MRPNAERTLKSLKEVAWVYPFLKGKIPALEETLNSYDSVSEESLAEESVEKAAHIRLMRDFVGLELANAVALTVRVDNSFTVLKECCGERAERLVRDMYCYGKPLKQIADEEYFAEITMLRNHKKWSEDYAETMRKEAPEWMRA